MLPGTPVDASEVAEFLEKQAMTQGIAIDLKPEELAISPETTATNITFRKVAGGVYAVICLGIMPKLLILTADSIAEMIHNEPGMTFTKVLQESIGIQIAALGSGALGSLAIMPFVVIKGYQFVQNLSLPNFIAGIFMGAPSTASIAVGSSRAWTEMGAPAIACDAAYIYGFLPGINNFEAMRQKMNTTGRRDLRNLRRFIQRCTKALCTPAEEHAALKISRAEMLRFINEKLDDQELMLRYFSSDEQLQHYNQRLVSLFEQSDFQHQLVQLMQDHSRLPSIAQRITSGMGDYVIAPAISAFGNINTFTYGQRFFSALFSFMKYEGLYESLGYLFATAGTAVGFMLNWYLLRESMIEPMARFFSKDLQSRSTWKQLMFNLLITLPAACVGTSNFALSMDNADLIIPMRWLTGLSLILMVTAISTSGISEWSAQFACMEKQGLHSYTFQLGSLVNRLREYLTDSAKLSDEQLTEVYTVLQQLYQVKDRATPAASMALSA